MCVRDFILTKQGDANMEKDIRTVSEFQKNQIKKQRDGYNIQNAKTVAGKIITKQFSEEEFMFTDDVESKYKAYVKALFKANTELDEELL